MDHISAVSHCLITLKSPTTRNKKQQKVAFMESLSEQFSTISTGSVLPSERCHSLINSSPTAADVEKLYNGCLLDLVCNVCTLCIDEITQENSLQHLNLLSLLIPHFTSTKLLKTLNQTSEESSISSSMDDNNYYTLSGQFLSRTLFPWMKLSSEQISSCDQKKHVSSVFTEGKSVEYVIAIFCGIIRTLTVDKQEGLVSRAFQVSLIV